MTESPNNQPNTPSRTSKGFKTSIEIILVALFSLDGLCMCLLLMEAAGRRDIFEAVRAIVIPLTLFVSLVWTIFAVLRGRVTHSSGSVKVSVGAILILLSVINSFFLVGGINFFLLNDFLYWDSSLYFILAVFIIGVLVSLWYFSYQKFQSRSIITVHLVVAVLFAMFFVFQYANVRKNQALVLQAYEDFYLSRPTEDLSIYNVDYEFWSNQAYMIVPDSEYAPRPTFWDRSTWGDYYEFKFVDGKWIFLGQEGYMLPSGD